MAKQLTALGYAAMALRAFQTRTDRRPRFKNPSRKRNQGQTVSQYKDQVAMARKYITLARQAGWRGSVYEACSKGEPLTVEV